MDVSQQQDESSRLVESGCELDFREPEKETWKDFGPDDAAWAFRR